MVYLLYVLNLLQNSNLSNMNGSNSYRIQSFNSSTDLNINPSIFDGFYIFTHNLLDTLYDNKHIYSSLDSYQYIADSSIETFSEIINVLLVLPGIFNYY